MTHTQCNPEEGRAGHPERGVAIFWVIIMIAMLTFAASVLAASIIPLIRESSRSRVSLAAFYAAEGGVELARAGLARDPAFSGGTSEVGRGRTEARIEPLPGRPDCRLVRVRGTVPGDDGPGSVIARGIIATLRLEAGRLPVLETYAEE
jgi:hypothetical protein